MNNAVFIWIPKNAGTSIYRTIEKNINNLHDITWAKELATVIKFKQKGIVSFGHMDYSLLIKKGYVSQEFDDGAFKFCFSRNPYDRAVSLFSYLKKNKIVKDKCFLDFCINLKNNKCESIGLYNRRGLSQCNPQITWIENIKNIDYTSKIESFNRDYDKIMNILNIKIHTMPSLNKSKHDDYKSYYSSESKKIIKEIYEEDFDCFGYSMIL